jgi:flagellar biosynthetic protein FliP
MSVPSRCIGLLVCAIALAVPGCAQQATAEAFWVHPEAHASQAVETTHTVRSNTQREQIVKTLNKVASSSKPAPARTAQPTPATPAQHATKPNTDAAQTTNRSIAEALATGQSSPYAIAVGLTLLTLVPAILLAMTPLVRLLVVFHFLRQALGTQTAPSNQILMALGLMMTWFLMQPVISQIEQQAFAPYRAGQLSGEDALARGAVPVKLYMLHYARDKDLELFASASQTMRLEHREDAPMQVVVPAYMLSELKAGFQIGAILFLPFLLIDLVVASITTSIGMLQMPPTIISTPVKILLFVTVDGWHLLASSLLKSF